MPTMDLITEYVIRYGFQVLGAVLVFALGALVARWAGGFAHQWLEHHDMEPPVRMLLVKTIQVLILVFTTMAALGQLGVQIAPLLAGVGVAGLGVRRVDGDAVPVDLADGHTHGVATISSVHHGLVTSRCNCVTLARPGTLGLWSRPHAH